MPTNCPISTAGYAEPSCSVKKVKKEELQKSGRLSSSQKVVVTR
jgi:hypothetical protein